MLTITILSDLLHDVRGEKDKSGISIKRKDEIKKNWDALELKIRDIAENLDIVVNMIILTKDGLRAETNFPKYKQIFSDFDKNLEWHELTENYVAGNLQKKLFFQPIISKQEINFYYETDDHIMNTVDITHPSEETSSITIDIPSEIDFKDQRAVRYRYISWGQTIVHGPRDG